MTNRMSIAEPPRLSSFFMEDQLTLDLWYSQNQKKMNGCFQMCLITKMKFQTINC